MMLGLLVLVKILRLHLREETLSAIVYPEIKVESSGATLWRDAWIVTQVIPEHSLNIARIIQIVAFLQWSIGKDNFKKWDILILQTTLK